MHAHPAGQRLGPAIHMRVAPFTPRETGKKPDSCQLGQQPQRGKKSGAQGQIGGGEPHKKHGGAGVVKRQEGRQHDDRQHGKRRGQPAVHMQGNKQPPESGAQHGAGKQAAQPGRAPPGAAAVKLRREQDQRQHLQPVNRHALGRAEGEWPRDAGGMRAAGEQNNEQLKQGQAARRRRGDVLQQRRKGRQGNQAVYRVTPRQPGFHDASGRAVAATGETLNQRTAPPLVCSTLNCRPASA